MNQYHYSAMPLTTHHQHYSRPAARVSSTTEFRGSLNPDEDWTKISDLAERRRIQNRIAQRNYRRKLKRRLEDLERRAASRSLSPNGDDTDGRSTRESSAEQPLQSPPPSSEPVRESYLPPASSAYSTSSYYRTAGSLSPSYAPTFSATDSNYYYPAATTGVSSAHLPAISALHYYTPTCGMPLSSVVEATCGTPATLSSVVDATCGTPLPSNSGAEHSYLPLPSARISGSYSSVSAEYAAPKTAAPYGQDTMSPLYLSYAGLADTPDPNYFANNYYAQDHHHHHSAAPTAIKQEN